MDGTTVVMIVAVGALALFGITMASQSYNQEQSRTRRESSKFNLYTHMSIKMFGALVPLQEAIERRFAQLAYKDVYGRWNTSAWRKEIDYLFRTVALPLLPSDLGKEDLAEMRARFEEGFDFDPEELHACFAEQAAEASDGIAYERQVASALARLGFGITFTPVTGDQGVDLIAELGATRIAIQCKNYSSPVGNDAVQQVHTGAKFYGAERAIIVAPNGYTPAARQLASSVGVDCLHHDDIDTALADWTHSDERP